MKMMVRRIMPSLGRLVRRAVGFATLAAYIFFTFAVAHSSSYHQGLFVVAASFAMLALSLDLAAGALGLYSLGHAGLFAVGAYGTAVLYAHNGVSIFVALPVVAATASILGMVIGVLSERVSGLYFAIATLIFTIIVNVLISNLSITGGYQGMPSPPFPGFPASLSRWGNSLIWVTSVFLLATVIVIWNIRSSAFYPILLAVRDSESFAVTSGVHTALVRVLMFGFSSLVAGIAGWCFAFQGFITPGQFDSTASINVLVMVILGGINTLLGPIIGAVFVSLFPAVISIDPLWQEILFGAIFIATIVFFPEGFVGLLRRLRRLIGGPPGGRMRIVSARRLATSNASSSVCAPEAAAVAVPGSRPALEARGIRFSYGDGPVVLDGVDVEVRRGTIHGLIGPNGSGKSTLVNILAGILRPQSGTVVINGQRVDEVPAWRRTHLGVMRTFQNAMMVKELSIADNVSVGLYRWYPRVGLQSFVWPALPKARRNFVQIAALTDRALSWVGLGATWFGTRVADAPHGVEQLAQLAAACVSGPSVLILDEPLAGLSLDEIGHVAEILRSLRKSGVTVVVIEHQTRFIFEVCDQVTVLAAGKVVKSGVATEVRNDQRVREVYLGR